MKPSNSKALWYTSVAAGAAVGPVAHGTVIYTDVVPDISGSLISWDMDNGGSNDFRLEVTVNAGSEKTGIVPTNPNAGIALDVGSNVDRMASGETIGPATPFSNPVDKKFMFDEANPGIYDWSVGSRGFVGLRFDLNGNTHYGWADISINPQPGSSFNHTLFAYAYENVPSADVLAGAVPEPTTAMLLVAGAAGAASVRRRRS